MKVEYDKEKNAKHLKEIPIHSEVLLFALKRTPYFLSWTDWSIESSIVLQKDNWMKSFRIYPGQDERTAQIVFYPYEHSEDMRERTGRDYKQETDECIDFIQEFVKSLRDKEFDCNEC